MQSTSAGGRYRYKITGLTNGIEYTVRVIATNANGDSDPSGEATGTPQPTPGQVRLFIENEVIEIFEGSHPWLRDTWDYITTQNVTVEFTEGTGGSVSVACAINDPLEPNLRKCYASLVQVGRFNPRMIYMITHELAHVYTLANSVTSTSGPLGVAFLYFYDLISPRYDLLPPSAPRKSRCRPMELYADALSFLTHGDRVRAGLYYWQRCTLITDTVSDQAVAVVRNAATGEMPSWFADTYDDPDGDPDLARFWSDVKAIPDAKWRATAVFQLRDAFGGYCDNQKATDSAFGSGVTRIPWSDGGCVPEAPTNVSSTAVGSGKLTVSWQEPLDDGGSPVEGYKVQWKSGTQEYGSSRQAVVTNLTDPQQTISGLTNDESHTLRVLAYNHNGDGAAAETTAMPTATDTTAPALLTARVDRDFSFLRLTWNEALDESSVPARSAFTVNINGVSRPFSVGVLDNVVTLSLALAGGVKPADVVTVGYTAPTGPTASPLRDSAGNNAPDFSAQMVRNDATHVALTSDPGPDMTYSWNNGSGGQDVIEATVTFSEPVLVSGVPELKLYVGGKVRRAAYRSGSGTTSLVFRYVLTEGETDDDGISVAIGSIAGLVRYASTKASAPARVRLDPQAGHLVDAVRPALVHANALANGNDVTLRWDKALDEDSVPAPSDPGFEVRDTSANTRLRFSAITVLGKVVTLTLSSAVSATDQLTVSYDVLSDPLKDSVGNYAEQTSAAVSITLHPNSPPGFSTAEDGIRSVDENTPARRNIGTPIAATDADSDGRTYSISGTESAFFDVVATSGQLRTKAALDHESRDSYSFTMSVTDGKDVHGNADTTVDDTISVTVTVEDVAEGPPPAPAGLTATLAEGVFTISWTAVDGASRYEVQHRTAAADSQWTALPETTGLSATYAPADGPDCSTEYRFRVRAYGDGDTYTEMWGVESDVEPVETATCPPEFGQASYFFFIRDTSAIDGAVGTVTAADPDDGDTVGYAITAGNDAGKFSISSTTGQLTVSGAFDIAATPYYTLTVEASDGQGGKDTAEAVVSLTIADCYNGAAVPRADERPRLVRDCSVLLTARDALRGTGSLNWSPDLSIDEWQGIYRGYLGGRYSLDGADIHVKAVIVSRLGLNGSIPSLLAGLVDLRRLDLDDNALTGGIPVALGQLESLEQLHLLGNRLTGNIPVELGNLANLRILSLYANDLTGDIPPELGKLTKLEQLLLDDNDFTGELPSELGNIAGLERLFVRESRLSGEIPAWLASLEELEYLYLEGNDFTGCIPSGLRDVENHDLDRLGLDYCTP